MDFWKKLRGELVDIIQWPEDNPQSLVWKFPRFNDEIKNGAQLIVRPGQAAVFVDQGCVADVFESGRHRLSTDNLPILSTLRGWAYGFQSPFKADVYFVATRLFTDLKWGTMNPVMVRDPEFGPVRLRAYGTYTMRCTHPSTLIAEVAGAGTQFTVDGIVDQLRNMIVSRFTTILGESRIPILDLAGNYDALGQFLSERIGASIAELGLELRNLLVENISLPPNVEEALDKRSSMGIIGDLNKYTQYQTAQAIGDAAKNPGGGMGDAMGLGAGFAMAQQMAHVLAPQQQQQGHAAPPPIPGSLHFHVVINGQQAGPFSLEELGQQASRGTLRPETLVWKPGLPQWIPASQVPSVAGVLAAPPPIPGAPQPPAES